MQSKLIDLIKLPFRKEKELYLSLREILGYCPHNIKYYKHALLHKSAKGREKGKPINNERLEFLGDSILGAVVSDIVYKHFQGKREGFLTNTRSKIVQRETLNKLAKEMGITQLVKNNDHSSSHNSYMGGNAFEALMGAIYLDRGYNACMRFVEKRILSQLINIDKVAYKEVNFKSKLLEWGQKNRVRIEFRQTQQEKDDKGNNLFHFQVFLEGLESGSGKGYSKKESQQIASRLTLEQLRKNPKFIDDVFAAKTSRTQMEEEPVQTVPDTEDEQNFVIVSNDVKPSDDEPQKSPASPAADQPAVAKQSSVDRPRRSSTRSKGSSVRPSSPDKPASAAPATSVDTENGNGAAQPDEFDLSDISATPRDLSDEEIIAAAEAAAFEKKAPAHSE